MRTLWTAFCFSPMSALMTAVAFSPAVTAQEPQRQEPAKKITERDFGPNVIIFEPNTPLEVINHTLQRVEKNADAWNTDRTAIYFMPGTYGALTRSRDQANATGYVDTMVGPMTSIQGLGEAPGDVIINGNFRILGNLGTFWRSLQNLRINPVDPEAPHTLRWIVSEASPLRRLDVAGNLDIGVGHIAFGSAIGNSRVSGEVRSGNGRIAGVPGAGGQAHYYIHDSEIGGWSGKSLNFVFSGVEGAPPTDFDPGDKTTLEITPIARDAPFLFIRDDEFKVFVPKARMNSRGFAWGTRKADGDVQPVSDYFIAKPGAETAAAINAALESGKNILLTPGLYELDRPLHVTRPNTVILGMGYATLMPTRGTAAILTDDVPGVVISSLLVDAGVANSNVLIQLGPQGASGGDAANPSTLVDVYVRVGGRVAGKATTSVELNQNHALLNHSWIWRADGGPAGTSMELNPGDVGLVVNGNDVTVLGTYVEHYRKQQVIWNGDAGHVLFLQSEPMHDALTQVDRMNGTEKGYPYFELAPTVKTFEGVGFALYGARSRSTEPIIQTSQIKAPEKPGVRFRSITAAWLFGWGQYLNTFNSDGRAVGMGLHPSVIPGIASTRHVRAWPDK